MMRKSEFVKAVMLGHAVADALGVPVEFSSRGELCKNPVVDMREFGTHNQPRGTFSDDTSMSIAALDAISGGEPDYLGTMKNFVLWYERGDYTSGGSTFDIGSSCLCAINSFCISGEKEAFGHAETGEFSCGNGALMRIHPFAMLAYYKNDDIEERLKIIYDATSLTHAHPRCLIASGIYSLILFEIMNGGGKESISRGISLAREVYKIGSPHMSVEFSEEIDHFKRIFEMLGDEKSARAMGDRDIRSSGYVIDSLEAALWSVLTTEDYKSAVLRAVNLGEDTDTVAAIAGGLAGALYGMNAIPAEWLSALLGREAIESMCEVFSRNM